MGNGKWEMGNGDIYKGSTIIFGGESDSFSRAHKVFGLMGGGEGVLFCLHIYIQKGASKCEAGVGI